MAQSPKVEMKKGSSTGFKLFAFAITGFTVGLGYATLNPESRKQVEQYVPQSKQLFDYIDQTLGFKPSAIQEKISSAP
jgi:hypothetical protein